MRVVLNVSFAVMTIVMTQAAQGQGSDDRWWEGRFKQPQFRSQPQYQPPTPRWNNAVPRVAVMRPTLKPEKKDPVGPIVLEPMPASIQIPGKVIVFFINLQQFAAYDNGTVIVHNGALLQGPISSGSPGHATPITDPKKGLLHTVGTRQVDYVSNSYPEPDGGAPMPHAQFFRDDGIAMHAGFIDLRSRERRLNHGLSHGCVRLIPTHAKILYEMNADRAMKVLVVRTVDELQKVWEPMFAKPV